MIFSLQRSKAAVHADGLPHNCAYVVRQQEQRDGHHLFGSDKAFRRHLVEEKLARFFHGLAEVLANLRMLSSTISVSTKPGQIALTVTLCGAASTATSRVKPMSACLEATYAARLGPMAIFPEVEMMFTMWPWRRSNISPMIARVV
jgi:hypothetical protein